MDSYLHIRKYFHTRYLVNCNFAQFSKFIIFHECSHSSILHHQHFKRVGVVIQLHANGTLFLLYSHFGVETESPGSCYLYGKFKTVISPFTAQYADIPKSPIHPNCSVHKCVCSSNESDQWCCCGMSLNRPLCPR